MFMRRSRYASLIAVAFLTGAMTASHAPVASAQPPDAKTHDAKHEAKAPDGAAAPHALSAADAKKKAAEDKVKKKQAGKIYKAASKLFKAEKWAEAIEKYQEADGVWPGAAPKWKIAQATDKLGDNTKTLAAYQAFLDSSPSEKYADRVVVAKKRVAEIEATMPAKLTVTITPADAKNLSVSVDGGKLVGNAIELKAGEHTVIITADGFQPKTEVLMLKGNETRDLQLALLPVAVVPPPPPPPEQPKPEPMEPPEERSNIPAYVTLGIAGAGVVLGTVFGVMALGAKGDFDDAPTTENADDAERAALIADMSFGVALTFGITGAVLLFSGDDEPEETGSAKPIVVPYAGPTGGGVLATWQF